MFASLQPSRRLLNQAYDYKQREIKEKQMSTTTIGLKNPLTSAFFAQPPLHIPDLNGKAYKTELVIFRSDDLTIKINWWHDKDPRPEPHDHPWDFTALILHGGYTETRYDRVGNNLGEFSYVAGDTNVVSTNIYHTVDSVLPGTVSLMVCGHGTNTWGHLINGVASTAISDPDFFARMVALNTFKAK